MRPVQGTGSHIWDVIVVGAGFSGLHATYRLRELGLSVLALDVANDVGGTWFWNRYPGARCDIESVDYSLSYPPELQAEWDWTERYAAQPEILRYLNFVADRLDLRKHFRFETHVESILLDDAASIWRISTSAGEAFAARYVIMASGVLSSPKKVDFPGLDDFGGQVLRTSSWPHEGVDLAGKRVAVIGTGSTGVQAIPLIAETAAELLVLQRTANFSVPARNRRLRPGEMDDERRSYPERRSISQQALAGMPEFPSHGSALDYSDEQRQVIFEEAWAGGGGPRFIRVFNDISSDPVANETAAAFVRAKIQSIVHDPATARLLTPTDHPIGARRLCLDSGYYETFNRPNVRLIDVREGPIVGFTATSLRTTKAEFDVDVIVLATGFDAVTGALLSLDIRGRAGVALKSKWTDGPVGYLGIAMHGFPNLFMVVGPGSPSVLGNVVTSVEQHIGMITTAIGKALEEGATSIEVSSDAETDWTRAAAERAKSMLLASTRSWYNGGNIEGKPNVVLAYTGGVGKFREICDTEIAAGYPSFAFTPGRAPATSPDR